jgi:hypothetical protein
MVRTPTHKIHYDAGNILRTACNNRQQGKLTRQTSVLLTIEADQCIVHYLQTAARRYRVPIDAEFLTSIKHRVACDLDQRCGICATTYVCLMDYT